MTVGLPVPTAADEALHPVDPAEPTWSESWLLSFVDGNGGPAGLFRVGVLSNQRRAMLWCFVHVGDEWFAIEESRLHVDDLVLHPDGVAYDRWALAFSYRGSPPLDGARFSFAGDALVRTGPRSGRHVPVSIDLTCRSTAAPVPTGSEHPDRPPPLTTGRFEQPMLAVGRVTVDGTDHAVRGGAHRDKSWGPRDWRHMFSIGDLQTADRQLYFVARTIPGLGMAFVRDREQFRPLVVTDGAADFDDEADTIRSAWLRLEDDAGPALVVRMTPIAPSVSFDMAHTCDLPERWRYWRTLVEAHVLGEEGTGWGSPCRGWFESSRYGVT